MADQRKPLEHYGVAVAGPGGDWLHEAFPVLKAAFPEATEVELYGASVTWNFKEKTATYRCGGKEHVLPIE